jgi:NAD(P)-dependent dehydrogenase (short-subunit alcohol dehydrogenase family)
VQGDAGNLVDLDRLYDAVRAEKARIDILYANAGVEDFNVPLGSITEANFDNTFNVNVRGTLFTAQKAAAFSRSGAKFGRRATDSARARAKSACSLITP